MESTKYLRNSFQILKDLFQQSLNETLNRTDIAIKLTSVPNNIKQDYACPSAVSIFNQMKKDKDANFQFKSAYELGENILQKIDIKNSFIIDNIDLNKGGFMAIKLKDSYVEQEINTILKYGLKLQVEKQKIITVDFSSPNIAKEMHVGHLRSTIIGDSVCRIQEFLGHKVNRHNHLGDWGTQFGMLIQHLKEAYPDWKNNMPQLKDLETFYKASKKRFDDDPEFKKASQLNVVDLQSGEPLTTKAWQTICELSRIEFTKIYNRLDVVLEEMGESFYNSRIPQVIEDAKQKDIIKLDNGAQCIFIKGSQFPLMVVKSDGAYNYDSTDLAAIKYRLQELKSDRIIVITDKGQECHFYLINNAAILLGYHTPPKTQVDHMGFGVVLGPDGKKFKTRDGQTIKLMELLNTAQQMALQDLKKRLEEQKEGQLTKLTQQEIEEAAEKIGIAAIKYYDLRQHHISDYKFEYNKMLDFKGNTAVYLLYSYVRLCSIIRKSEISPEQLQSLIDQQGFTFTHEQEKHIASLLIKFAETIDQVSNDLLIHKITDLLYAISVKLAESYQKYRVIDNEHKNQRILLIEATRKVMLQIFQLLGIKPIEKI